MALLLPLRENDEQTLLLLYLFPCVDADGEKQREHLSKRLELLSHYLLKFQRPKRWTKTRHRAKGYLLALAFRKWLQGFYGVCYPRWNNIRKRYCEQGRFAMIFKTIFCTEPANGLRYPRWGGRRDAVRLGKCWGVEKGLESRQNPQRRVHALLARFWL